MSKTKKLSKYEKEQRRKEEALKAQNTVRGFNVSTSMPVNGSFSTTSKNLEKDALKENKFLLPIAQIKKDFWKTVVFIVLSTGVVVYLQKYPLFLDKFSAIFHF